MHSPVLLKEAIEYLNLSSGKKVIDGTVGDGGHAAEIIKQIEPTGRFLGIDLDPVALRTVQEKIKTTVSLVLVHDNFKNIRSIAENNDFVPVDAILLDLGWRRTQFEESGLGFSFLRDEPLDMRYGRGEEKTQNLTAAEIINDWTAADLLELFQTYGEEALAVNIVKKIIKARRMAKITRTIDLAELILATYREKLGSKKEIPWIGGLHPATKVFQSLRIAVNDELANLRVVLEAIPQILGSGGRLAVISFHSLEDRLVKNYFKQQRELKIITKKPVSSSPEEIKDNPASRSAKLRVAEKI